MHNNSAPSDSVIPALVLQVRNAVSDYGQWGLHIGACLY